MSPPTKELMKLTLEKKIAHGGQPVLRWMMDNIFIRTDPAAGTQVAAGSTVILYISRPQVSTTTKVPSLTGMSVDDARTLLVQNHLGLGSQSEEYSDQPAGTVLSQNPAAGTTAKLNSRVNVVVSAGAAPAQEPEQPGSDGTSGTTGEGSTGGSVRSVHTCDIQPCLAEP